MGDRANVRIIPGPGEGDPVYLYTHCGGTELPNVVHWCLEKFPGCRDDPGYLASIILRHMHGSEWEGETGTGISTVVLDNEHPIIVLDVHNQLVSLTDRLGMKVIFGPVPFSEFVESSKALRQAYAVTP